MSEYRSVQYLFIFCNIISIGSFLRLVEGRILIDVAYWRLEAANSENSFKRWWTSLKDQNVRAPFLTFVVNQTPCWMMMHAEFFMTLHSTCFRAQLLRGAWSEALLPIWRTYSGNADKYNLALSDSVFKSWHRLRLWLWYSRIVNWFKTWLTSLILACKSSCSTFKMGPSCSLLIASYLSWHISFSTSAGMTPSIAAQIRWM